MYIDIFQSINLMKYVCVCVFIYTKRETERVTERERETERDNEHR